MKSIRTIHLLYQGHAKQFGAAVAINETGFIFDYKAMSCQDRDEFEFMVYILREHNIKCVTNDDFDDAKRNWRHLRRNVHYCNTKIHEWTKHCPRDYSTLSLLKVQAAIYHGIQNENKHD